MEVIKIQGKPWQLTRSGRGYVTLREKKKGDYYSVTKEMSSDTKGRLSKDVAGWEKEMDRLALEAVKEARRLVRCR